MPEDSKKTTHKGKQDSKDQRKPRQPRQHGAEKAEKKIKKSEIKVAEPSKPVYDEPGPEFYQNLKRETDEILKITEETDSKYKKKEIQSNWTKYEMPIESYDEMVEQENLGADYEKLTQGPQSVGGHFQFKHEKNWAMDTGPSLYDKYFEIDMENLATAINSVPFYERNNLDQAIFSKSDILTMNSRATKYKRKYYNEKVSESEAPENTILRLLTESVSEENVEPEISENKSSTEKGNIEFIKTTEMNDDINLESKNVAKVQDEISKLRKDSRGVAITEDVAKLEQSVNVKSEEIEDIDDLLLDSSKTTVIPHRKETKDETPSPTNVLNKGPKSPENPPAETKPAIESPEDLEKWLDDFLEG